MRCTIVAAMDQNKKKIIVVGAGPGGLACALILAHRGFDVVVLEKAPRVGGRNSAIEEQGYTFDTGPTFLMMKFILDEIFEEAGRKTEDYLQCRRLDPLYRLSFGADAKTLIVPDSVAAKIRAIEELFPSEAEGFKKFLEQEETRFQKLYPCIQQDYSSLSRFFSWKLISALPHLGLFQSVYRVLGRYFRDERLKLAFSFQSKYLGMAPWDCPALFTMLSFIEHRYGIFHVIGGLNRISGVMAQLIQEEGGRVLTDSPVRELVLNGKKVTGVGLASGELLEADEVVVNADFAHAMIHLVRPGTLKTYTTQKIQSMEYSCSTFMLYLGIDKQYTHLNHHNIFFSENYQDAINNLFAGKPQGDDFSFYVQNPHVTDASLAPAGKSTIYVLVPAPNNRSDLNWIEYKKTFRDQVLRKLERVAGLIDLENHIEVEKIISPADWEHKASIYLGATFNLSHIFPQLLYRRPHNRFEDLDSCYLVGGGTHPGSGLPTILESARISANMISQKYGIPFRSPPDLGTRD
jgi:phytoene desaturase